MAHTIPYETFLKNKVRLAKKDGFEISVDDINPALKPHNKLMVKWLVEGGRRACFAPVLQGRRNADERADAF